MSSSGPDPSRLWALIRGPRDPRFEDAAISGELLVARFRVAVVSLLLLLQLTPNAHPRERAVGLALTGGALLLALVILSVLKKHYRHWVGLATSGLDVSLVSLALAVFIAIGQPHAAVNSKITFEAYFLAIAGAGLRYDWRACVLAGILATGQYAALVAYADLHFDLNDPRYEPFLSGRFSWNPQIARMILMGAASAISTAIVLRSQRLRLLSTTDRLTSLHNRGVFEERFEEEVNRSRRHGRPFAVALVDVDHFKVFNDNFGHAGGDVALRAVARHLRLAVRRSDVVARYGGEEFALLLPETTAEEALGKMETIRRAFASSHIEVGALLASLTISVGVASFPADGDSMVAVLSEADSRLYEAKRRGRNRTVGPERPSSSREVTEPAAPPGTPAPDRLPR